MSSSAKSKRLSERIRYHPANAYPYDLEIFRVSDLKKRTSEEGMLRTYNYEFYMIILVTDGQCVQLVDFNSVSCNPGDLLLLRPGQAHNFGRDKGWDGWVILFRPEFVPPNWQSLHDLKLAVDLEQMPEQLMLQGDELQRITGLIAQMRSDALIVASIENVHALLRHQILLLLTLLNILHGRQQAHEGLTPHALQRFKKFQVLVEKHYATWHQVAEYAGQLGCTEKSLTRASLMAVGMTAKAFIATRINLEAKRLLAHTDLPITDLAETLGFEETTNFTKFFKRETGCTPTEFRRRHSDSQDL
jgi:AraC-like DNA-binding protein